MVQNRQIDESLSALMDGEAQDLEVRRILKKSESIDDATRDDWARLHLAKSALHADDDALAFAKWDISAQVSAAIADEANIGSSQKTTPTWLKPFASVAVAAGVAAVVVFGFGGGVLLPGQNGGDGGTNIAATSQQEGSRAYPAYSKPAAGGVTVGATPLIAPRFEGDRGTSEQAVSKDAIERFNLFLQKHTERAALNNGPGVVSYARNEQAMPAQPKATPVGASE
jgi:sigma-E factor negative regulatory protein RseA